MELPILTESGYFDNTQRSVEIEEVNNTEIIDYLAKKGYVKLIVNNVDLPGKHYSFRITRGYLEQACGNAQSKFLYGDIALANGDGYYTEMRTGSRIVYEMIGGQDAYIEYAYYNRNGDSSFMRGKKFVTCPIGDTTNLTIGY